MVVEITSPDEDSDVERIEKRDAYAQASIPAYLLVDRHHADVTIYWEPVEGAYQHVSTAKFGSALRMPPPFDFDLETSEFL